MIDNTKRSVEQITGQIKGIDAVRRLLTLLIYAAYLIYRMVLQNGYLVLNIILLVCTVCYSCYYVFFLAWNKKILQEKTAIVLQHVYNWSRIILSAIGIGLTVSAFLSVADNLSPINLLLAVLMPLFSVLQIVFEILTMYILYCINLLKDGVDKDIDNIKESTPIQAVNGVKNTIDGFKSIKNGLRDAFGAFLRPDDKQNTPKERPEKEKPVKKRLTRKLNQEEILVPEDLVLPPAPQETELPLIEEATATITPSIDDISDPQ